MRKLLALLMAIGLIVGTYSLLDHHRTSLDGPCAFCNPAVLARQTFYEDDLVLALYTHKPIFPGHCLVIPKRHVERFEGLTDEEITEMGRALKKVNSAVRQVFGTSPYILLQKNGREVGQTVPHVHIHYIPRKAGDSSALWFVIKLFVRNAMKPISPEETRENVEKLQAAIQAPVV